jgi:hypothetical protein
MHKTINLIIVIIFCGLFAGCSKNVVKITQQEDNGIKEVLKVYGGVCKYAISYSLNTKDGKERKFKIELSQSSGVEKYAKIAEMPASNIAYLFYKNISTQEETYNAIIVDIVFNDKSKQSFEFNTNTLDLVMQKMPTMNSVVALLKDRKYKVLEGLLDAESLVKYDKSRLIKNIDSLDARFGNITTYIPMGFRFDRRNGGEKTLHLSALIKRDIEPHHFSIDMSANPDSNHIYIINYQF